MKLQNSKIYILRPFRIQSCLFIFGNDKSPDLGNRFPKLVILEFLFFQSGLLFFLVKLGDYKANKSC